MIRKALFVAVGGVRRTFEGSQDYDLLLRTAENTSEIRHIPKLLYHWREEAGSIALAPSEKPYVFASGILALEEAVKRRNINGVAEQMPHAWPGVYRVRRWFDKKKTVSVIVHSHGDAGALGRLVASFFPVPERVRLEFVVAVVSDNRLSLLKNEFSNRVGNGIDRNDCNIFHTSLSTPAALNLAAEKATGDLLFFVDERMRLLSCAAVRVLAAHAVREEIGAAGPKVVHANGLIAHTGMIFGPFGLLGYAHRATPDDLGTVGGKVMTANFSAIPGFGLMCEKPLFIKANGFDEGFENAYWDADFGLRLLKMGYRNICEPSAVLEWFAPVLPVDRLVVEPEATLFRAKYKQTIAHDPYFNPNFSRKTEDFRPVSG